MTPEANGVRSSKVFRFFAPCVDWISAGTTVAPVTSSPSATRGKGPWQASEESRQAKHSRSPDAVQPLPVSAAPEEAPETRRLPKALHVVSASWDGPPCFLEKTDQLQASRSPRLPEEHGDDMRQCEVLLRFEGARSRCRSGASGR